MKNKTWFWGSIYLVLTLTSNWLFAANATKDASVKPTKDFTQTSTSSLLSDPNGCFEQNNKITYLNIKNIKELETEIANYTERKTVFLLGHRLYGINAEGEPAVDDLDEAFLSAHAKIFCFPQSIESQAFLECKKTIPTMLQFGDVRLPVKKKKYGVLEIKIIENLIKNLFTPLSSSQIIYKLDTLSNVETRNKFIHGLKSLQLLSFAANSINHIYAESIPIDPKDPNSPSIASSRSEEIDNRYYNPEWHEAVKQTNDTMELLKQLVLVSANTSAQLQTIIEQQQRIELLLAGMAINSANKDVLMSEILHAMHKD
jgi:hypothetical protein